ncbi:hypothetical protein AWB78_01045 [Caballeronia calidae]|uniref:Uncharacterized protein n=1 Tax=Caballeronia calidae TaxID=1777139 RepID=A0A157ZWP9_9BURK|nr:hypothetical protein AWB78_01045 [Caballeronia calidae]
MRAGVVAKGSAMPGIGEKLPDLAHGSSFYWVAPGVTEMASASVYTTST